MRDERSCFIFTCTHFMKLPFMDSSSVQTTKKRTRNSNLELRSVVLMLMLHAPIKLLSAPRKGVSDHEVQMDMAVTAGALCGVDNFVQYRGNVVLYFSARFYGLIRLTAWLDQIKEEHCQAGDRPTYVSRSCILFSCLTPNHSLPLSFLYRFE